MHRRCQRKPEAFDVADAKVKEWEETAKSNRKITSWSDRRDHHGAMPAVITKVRIMKGHADDTHGDESFEFG